MAVGAGGTAAAGLEPDPQAPENEVLEAMGTAYRELLEPHQAKSALARIPAEQAPNGQGAALIIEPLTEREREALRHLSEMLSTAEIATEMYISVNTVKSHLRSIYRKLSAAHRNEAVRRARQLELI